MVKLPPLLRPYSKVRGASYVHRRTATYLAVPYFVALPHHKRRSAKLFFDKLFQL